MKIIGSLYISLMPVILAGTLNMWFCKQSMLDSWKVPIDQGKLARDGKPIFGPNKTWKGFWGMIGSGIICQFVWAGFLSLLPQLESLNIFYSQHSQTWSSNLMVGALLGFAYIICELPNSYLKRRCDIEPGKQASHRGRWLFFLLDQIDSLIGCAVVVWLLTPANLMYGLALILLGAVTHVGVNQILYQCGLRSNPV